MICGDWLVRGGNVLGVVQRELLAGVSCLARACGRAGTGRGTGTGRLASRPPEDVLAVVEMHYASTSCPAANDETVDGGVRCMLKNWRRLGGAEWFIPSAATAVGRPR